MSVDGTSSTRAARMAALLTRDLKTPLPSDSSLHAGWRERAKAIGFGQPELAGLLWRERWPARGAAGASGSPTGSPAPAA